MFLFDVANQGFLLGFVPESVGVLIFAVALVLLTVGLRWLMKRDAKNAKSEIKHITEQN